MKKLNESGYDAQVFVLDAQNMGVPQTRRRCFVIARRRDLKLPELVLDFNEPVITFGEIREQTAEGFITKYSLAMWKKRKMGDTGLSNATARTRNGKESCFSKVYAYDHLPCPTLVTCETICFSVPRNVLDIERLRAATFPEDYDYTGCDNEFLTGMCVPPVMTAQIAHQIAVQLFKRK